MSPPEDQKPKKNLDLGVVWRESKEIIWARRRRLAMGFGLLLISRTSAMVLPASTKVLIDDVIGQQRADLLKWIALAAGAATLIQAGTSYLLSLILGIAAQRSITELRIKVHEHVLRLPVKFFEENKSGELISRVVTDAEGVRNLVGTGFVQLIGGLLTSALALGVLFWLNWRLTAVTVVLLLAFAGIMVVGFSRLRPLFRKRSELNASTRRSAASRWSRPTPPRSARSASSPTTPTSCCATSSAPCAACRASPASPPCSSAWSASP